MAVEPKNADVEYEIFDRQTNERIPGTDLYTRPYRATQAVSELEKDYPRYRVAYRPIKKGPITEAVTKVPLSNDDFELVMKVMEKPIPAVIAPIYIHEIIEDDELNDQLMELENTHPGMDIRPIIAEWFNRVMPDQMYRFTGATQSKNQKEGILSPIHGYDPKMFKGTNDPITGDAYGFRGMKTP
jgi:hypothetical protein